MCDVNRLVSEVCRKVFKLVGDDADVENPDVWIDAAKESGCSVVGCHVPGAAVAQYANACSLCGLGAIVYNSDKMPRSQAKQLAHELAHHVMWPVEPAFLFGEYRDPVYGRSPFEIRHDIASGVVRKIFADS
jgi:hypothetical protein